MYTIGNPVRAMTVRWSTIIHRISLAAAAVLVVSTAAVAQSTATLVGEFRVWKTYVANTPEKMCFIASQPQDSTYSQSVSSRDPAFFMVTTIPARNIASEASTIIGYPFRESSNVTIEVDGQQFSMFTQADAAWIEADQEPALVAAMKQGAVMFVKGTSRRGTQTTDTYSLSGVTAALEAAFQECSR